MLSNGRLREQKQHGQINEAEKNIALRLITHMLIPNQSIDDLKRYLWGLKSLVAAKSNGDLITRLRVCFPEKPKIIDDLHEVVEQVAFHAFPRFFQ